MQIVSHVRLYDKIFSEQDIFGDKALAANYALNLLSNLK